MVLAILVTRRTQVVELGEAVLLRDPLGRATRAADPDIDFLVVGVHACLGVLGRNDLGDVSWWEGCGIGDGTYELGVLAELAQGVDDVAVLLGAGHVVAGCGELEEAGQHGGEEREEGLHGCYSFCRCFGWIVKRCVKETLSDLRKDESHIRLVTSVQGREPRLLLLRSAKAVR